MERSTDIVIQGYGGSLRKKENRFVITHDDQVKEYACSKIRQILVQGECTITSGALRLAAEEGIDVVICLLHGAPSCRVQPCHGKGIAEIRRRQVSLASQPEGYQSMAEIIRAKIHNMGSLVKALGKRRSDASLSAEGDRILSAIPTIPRNGILPRDSSLLRGFEGTASRAYFSALSRVISPPLYQGIRSRHPAKDAFNACLNYGYGILYNEIERACILAGLDPHAGFLHADRYGHLSLAYDLIEQFRQPVIDRPVLTLTVHGQVSPGDLDEKGYLSPDAKRAVTVAVFARLDDERAIDSTISTFRSTIMENVRAFSNSLKDGTPYHAFQWRYDA